MSTMEKNHPQLYALHQASMKATHAYLEAKKKHQEACRVFMRELRASFGIPPKIFADLCGIKTNYVYMLEKGTRQWTDEMMEKAAQKLILM